MSNDRVSHETVERVLTTEPTRLLDALPDMECVRTAKALVREAADHAHRAVERVEIAEKEAVRSGGD